MEITQTSGPFKIKVSETRDLLIVTREYSDTIYSDEETRKVAEAHCQVIDFLQKVMDRRGDIWKFINVKPAQHAQGDLDYDAEQG